MRKIIYGSLLLLFICSCKKDTPKDPLENTSKLAGNHSWQGVKTVSRMINNGADTILETEEPIIFNRKIIVYNNKKLLVGGDTLYFAFTDKINKIIYTNSNDGSYAIDDYIDTLIYNFSNDSIEYRSFFMFNYIIYKYNAFVVK